MNGFYRIYRDNNIVAEFPNVLTNRGRIAIGRFLAGQRSSWGDVLVIGSGESTPLASNTELDMEFWKEEVEYKTYNGPSATPSNKLILRATIPSRVAGSIYEMGIFCTATPDLLLTEGPAKAIFDLSQEPWSSGTSDLINYRVGTQSLYLESGESSELTFYGDVRSFTPNTTFKLAYYSFGSVSAIKIRLSSDSSNYREFSFAPNNTGDYEIKSWNIQDFTQFGNPDWKEFYKVEIEVEGDGAVAFDIFSSYQQNPDDVVTVLVSRALVNVDGQNFIQKNPAREMQIEYLIDLGS